MSRHFKALYAIGSLLFLNAFAAHAQSSVRIYGTVDEYVGSMKFSGGQRQTQINSGGMTTSYIGLGGQEDLGHGLKVIFTLESYLRLDSGDSGRYTGDSLYSRAAYIGLGSERWGTLRFGRVGTPLFSNTAIFNPLGGSFGFSPAIRNIFSPGNISGDSAWNNAVAYSMPKIGGISGELIYSTKEGTGDVAAGGNIGGGLSYRHGGLSVGLAAQQVKNAFASGHENTWQIGAAYDFGSFKLFGQYTSIQESSTGETNANTHDKISQLGAAIPLGVGSVLVSWSRDKVSGAKDYDRDVATLGYDYRLSKRTDLYAMLMSDKMTSQTRGTSYAAGMRHAF